MKLEIKEVIQYASNFRHNQRHLVVNSVLSRMVSAGLLSEQDRAEGMALFRELNKVQS